MNEQTDRWVDYTLQADICISTATTREILVLLLLKKMMIFLDVGWLLAGLKI